MGKDKIPGKTIYRLSIYHRCLRRLEDAETMTISSSALAKAAGVNPSQLRRDLTYLGTFGTRGLGYSVLELTTAIGEILGRAQLQPVILVGAGNLGAALLRYAGFHKEGFEVVAAFDAAPEGVAQRGITVPVHHVKEMPEIVDKYGIRLAILSVPVEHAQAVTNDLVKAGIQGILSFSPTVLQVPENVTVNSVDLALELEQVSLFVKSADSTIDDPQSE
ncbi:redox-sensing transcriptional repressor Rex [bacterium]|nr:redox-sensing transcriptional repressor Rex [Akkermansiaceae bacterium]MDB4287721.1 redox-sensing transcriptional repressor Rex [bacterium]MDA7931789.1 redox-sensing transcriptional repressor Rex [Akkermansiaceae bacterium]MDA8967413.1 redox-sensing transcriptional repressor Rex [Akkermansiaceae bacterium]MDB4258082.1 redox-sensing transcriptional repressor Rex [Akkermansiaceae bacterium]